jgi:hypothetical protein
MAQTLLFEAEIFGIELDPDLMADLRLVAAPMPAATDAEPVLGEGYVAASDFSSLDSDSALLLWFLQRYSEIRTGFMDQIRAFNEEWNRIIKESNEDLDKKADKNRLEAKIQKTIDEFKARLKKEVAAFLILAQRNGVQAEVANLLTEVETILDQQAVTPDLGRMPIVQDLVRSLDRKIALLKIELDKRGIQ